MGGGDSIRFVWSPHWCAACSTLAERIESCPFRTSEEC